jgi:hypothetical protein
MAYNLGQYAEEHADSRSGNADSTAPRDYQEAA